VSPVRIIDECKFTEFVADEDPASHPAALGVPVSRPSPKRPTAGKLSLALLVVMILPTWQAAAKVVAVAKNMAIDDARRSMGTLTESRYSAR
jgi:hypothetical protein